MEREWKGEEGQGGAAHPAVCSTVGTAPPLTAPPAPAAMALLASAHEVFSGTKATHCPSR